MEYFLKFVRSIFIFPLAITVLFFISSVISYSNINLLNGELNAKVAKTSLLIKCISNENTSFRLAINEKKLDYLAYSTNLLEKFTSIKVNDMKSYLSSEIPGDHIEENIQRHPYISMESSPPLEVLLFERERSIQTLGQMFEDNPSSSVLSSDLISEITKTQMD